MRGAGRTGLAIKALGVVGGKRRSSCGRMRGRDVLVNLFRMYRLLSEAELMGVLGSGDRGPR